jgi:nucleoside phosphorylase
MIAVANGAGPERARLAVQAVLPSNPAAIYSIGYCGALDESLAVGDIFIADAIQGTEWCPLLPQSPAAKTGPIASISRIAGTLDEKRRLGATGALAVEMEAAGAAAAAAAANVSFYCIRAVSDPADEGFVNDFNRCLMPDGRYSIMRLLGGAMKSPVTRFRELIRLAARTSAASKRLRDFLASCTF